MTKAILLFDPISLAISVFNDLYPGKPCKIHWEQDMITDMEACGYTDFSGPVPKIAIDVSLPIIDVIETLAHELAHVAVGIEAEHGPEWEAAFDAMHYEYQKRVDSFEPEILG